MILEKFKKDMHIVFLLDLLIEPSAKFKAKQKDK